MSHDGSLPEASGNIDLAPQYPARVLLVDDVFSQVSSLIASLESKAFKVVHAVDQHDVSDKLRDGIFDIALIDVFIRRDAADTKTNSIGVSIATSIAERCPETVVVFISRPHVLSVEIVLQMFNYETRLQRPRLAEAYIEKRDTASVVAHCELLLDKRLHVDVKCPLFVDERWWSGIPSVLKRKVFANDEDPICPEIQMIQILRQLAAHEHLPLSEIEIRPIGRGRSRTMVMAMLCRYLPTEAEQIRVVKVGRTATVRAERENYLKFVVGFFQAGAYPMLTGFVESRQLGGVAYSFLGSPTSDPPTLADQFWAIGHSRAIVIADRIFDELLMPAKPPTRANGLLCNAYLTRFRTLMEDDLEDRVAGALRRAGCSAEGSERIRFLSPSEWSVQDIPSPVTLINDTFFDGYWQKVTHGDLHADNVLLVGESVYLIDFAHTGIGHVFIDHVVLEACVRKQLLRSLLLQVDKSVRARALRDWLKCESLIANEDWDSCATLCREKGDEYGSSFARLIEFIRHIRTNAWSTGCQDTRRNYMAGLGMVCLALIYIENDDECDKDVRVATTVAGALSLAQANAMPRDVSILMEEGRKSLAGLQKLLCRVFDRSRSRIEKEIVAAVRLHLKRFAERIEASGCRDEVSAVLSEAAGCCTEAKPELWNKFIEMTKGICRAQACDCGVMVETFIATMIAERFFSDLGPEECCDKLLHTVSSAIRRLRPILFSGKHK